MAPLKRDSSDPLYAQISDRLKESILGKLSSGDQLPSEYQLIAQYGVSRNTVRLAIDQLTRQGLVYRVKGKGTFVANERLRYKLFQLVSFTEEMVRRGLQPSSRLLRMDRVKAKKDIAEKLQLAEGDEVFLVERLRLANGKPMALNLSYHPCSLCPSLDQEDLSQRSIYSIIEENYGHSIAYADQILRPSVASKHEAEVLEIKKGSPLMTVEGVAYLTDNRPIEFAFLYYRGDRYEFPILAVRRSDAVQSAWGV